MGQIRNRLTILLVSACVTFLGCDDSVDRRPFATGTDGAITIVIDRQVWDGQVGESLRDELGKYIETFPVAEQAFTLERIDLTGNDFFKNVIRKRKYVVFAATLDEDSSVGRYLRAGLDSASVAAIRAGSASILQRPNPWYRGQMVVYAVAATTEELAAAIHEKGEDLRYVFNRVTRERLSYRMFRRMRQHDLEAQLLEGHGFAVNVQHDYFIAQDTLNFVRLRRVLSDTWREFFVYYIDDANPDDLTPEWILARRDEIMERFVHGSYEGSHVKVDRRRPITSENINFLDRFGYETRALWHMTGDAMGGPLLNYSFYDEEQRRIYMIDGMVFAPQFNKREFLRQIEVIAYSFRTAEREKDATAETIEQNGRGS